MSPRDDPNEHIGLGYPGPHPIAEANRNGETNLVRVRRFLSAASPKQILCLLLDFLKPDILRRRRQPPSSSSPSQQQQRRRSRRTDTAWLDGLRGWAAFGVCLAHMSVYTHPRIELCYGSLIAPSPDTGHASLRNATPAAVPVLRLFWSGGHFAVMIFFVISGYVLTKRPIALLQSLSPSSSPTPLPKSPLSAIPQKRQVLHNYSHDENAATAFVDALHSAMARRPLRLFLPVIWSTLFFATSWHVLGLATPWPEQQPNLAMELWNWARDLAKFCYFFRNRVLFTNYNIHTWTIPVELRGSYMVLVWLFLWGYPCFSPASSSSPYYSTTSSASHISPSTRRRVIATAAMTVYLAVGAAGAWYAAFFAGMLMAELDALDADAATSLTTTTIDGKLTSYNNNHHARPRLPWDGLLDFLRQRPRFRSVLLHSMLAAGLYLGSAPSSDIMKVDELLGNCPGGWKTLSRLIPAPYTASDEPESVHRWFWLFWAAWLLFVSIKELDWVRSLFETRFSQYLGKHSFALYLVHGPLIGLYAERLFYLTGVKRGPLSDDEAAKFGHLMNRWRDSPRWWPLPRHDTPSAIDARQPYYYGLEPEFLLCVALSVPVFLYAAELGAKTFDEPSVRASRWAYRKLKGA
ncbi:acyltransferase-like protein [Apiospora arundinis]